MREKKYPSTLDLTFDGIIKDEGKRIPMSIDLDIAIKVMNDKQNEFNHTNCNFNFIDGKSFSGKCTLKFPNPNLYHVLITSQLTDTEGKIWKGPQRTMKVRVL